MLTDSSVSQPEESLKTVKNHIRLGTVPDWVETCPFPPDFKAKQMRHETHLLFDQQINAELGQTYFHVALRLDTMQAVQNQAPWRLDFEPRHQQVTLHSIKVWRGEAQVEHADLSTARVVDREPRGFAAREHLALLLMLEDIRPGDILEWSYTVEDRPLLLSNYCAGLFALPVGAPVGKFHFSVRFDPARPMQWRAWTPEWQPAKSEKEDEVVLTWTRENFQGIGVEPNLPEWHINYPWIQVSDCPDWGTIAGAFAEAWEEVEEDPVAGQIAGEIAAGEGAIHDQVEKAIQMVQDEYRYLEFSGKLDGQKPAAPEVVARRRYGDCKDLSFLLLHLLKRLGAQARLVLVNTVLRQSVAGLLPSPAVFDHVLVEYQMRGETRWVDATLKREGAAALNRVMRDYGAGLPVAAHSIGLAEQPADWARGSVYELTESILLDTTGGWSWLGVVVAAGGSHAEAMRLELEREGVEGLAKRRLRQCVERFTQARRVGELAWRDDRAANQFFLAEIFEIKDFLTVDPKTKWYKLQLPNDYAVSLLKTPDSDPEARRGPFALPHPCNIAHTIELYSVALPPTPMQQRGVESEFLHFNRVRKTLAGNWTMRLTLSTLADAILPESLDEYQRTLREIREQCAWTILVPSGDARPHQRSDFAALPTSWEPSYSMPERQRPRPLLATVTSLNPPGATPILPDKNGSVSKPPKESEAPVAAPTEAPSKNSRRKRREKRSRKRSPEAAAKWQIAKACVFGLVLILIVVFVAKNADRFHIFKIRPTPPVPADDLGM